MSNKQCQSSSFILNNTKVSKSNSNFDLFAANEPNSENILRARKNKNKHWPSLPYKVGLVSI
jgi:hypothetical protein